MRSPLNLTTRSMFYSLNYILDTADVRALLSNEPLLAPFIPELEQLRKRIEKIYSDAGPVPSVEEEKRLRRENAELDRRHDKLVRVLHDLLVLAGRVVDNEAAEELEGVLLAVLPAGLSSSLRRYVEEAAEALLLEETLKRPGMEEMLAAVSVGYRGTRKSALELVRELIETGRKLQSNLMLLDGEEMAQEAGEKRDVRLRFAELIKVLESTAEMVWRDAPQKTGLLLSAYHGELKSLASGRKEGASVDTEEQPAADVSTDDGE